MGPRLDYSIVNNSQLILSENYGIFADRPYLKGFVLMIRYKTLKVRSIEISADESEFGLRSGGANYHDTHRIGRQIFDSRIPEILCTEGLDASCIVEGGCDISYH